MSPDGGDRRLGAVLRPADGTDARRVQMTVGGLMPS